MSTITDIQKIPTAQEGDLVDLGAAGKFLKKPDGSYQIAPTTTAPNIPPMNPQGTTPTSGAVLSSTGARDAIVKAQTYITNNTPPPANPGAGVSYDPNNPFNVGADGKPFQGTGNYTDTSMPNKQTAAEAYMQANDPESLTNFKTANPGLQFTDEDLKQYLGTGATGPSSNPALDEYTKKLTANMDASTAATNELTAKRDAITARLDAANAQLVTSITNNYTAAIAKQQQVNKAYLGGVTQSGIRGGQQRYSPEDYAGEIMTEANAGIDRITKLENERDSLIAQANNANAQEDWTMFYQTYGDLQKNRDAQAKNLQDLYEKSQALADKAQEQAQQQLTNLKTTQDINTKTIDSIASLADANLAEFEKNGDTEGGAAFIKELSDQYGIDANQLLSKVEEVRKANKGWSEPYQAPGVGQVQRNLQTGEVRVLKAISSGGGDGNDILSPTEAQTLGVPYGTTKGQASGMGITPKKDPKPATVAQQTVATYAARIEQSDPILKTLEPTIKDMNPLVFEAQSRLPSYLQSAEFQQFDQAARNFINSVLRRESGAVISPSEFDNANKQYLPRPGDTAATLKQKEDNRKIAYETFKKGAGEAYQSVDEILGTSGSTTRMKGPDGKLYDVPNDQVDAFKKEGGTNA